MCFLSTAVVQYSTRCVEITIQLHTTCAHAAVYLSTGTDALNQYTESCFAPNEIYGVIHSAELPSDPHLAAQVWPKQSCQEKR